ncbi:MAG: hypothetical protein Unbinned1819contig1001_48 [Prokaryotic dsDNA virus sp.]|nr:MAG: hypothetical protein Unbinned1819contig1001_48 [Prokaryotic dsDNA virus sp.]|tara:strand:+ start:28095 stop:28388 length:294 start_codon:yes stop_codon:yes gene_type:complete
MKNSAQFKKERVSVSLSQDELLMVELQASERNTTRNELLRISALNYLKGVCPVDTSIPLGRAVVAECVEDVARKYSGIPRNELVGMVSAIIVKLNSL